MPRCLSASAAARRASIAGNASVRPSSTMKSLPRPCILMKGVRMTGAIYALIGPASRAGWARPGFQTDFPQAFLHNRCGDGGGIAVGARGKLCGIVCQAEYGKGGEVHCGGVRDLALWARPYRFGKAAHDEKQGAAPLLADEV